MKTFRSFILEIKDIDSVPVIPHEENWLHSSQTEPYTKSSDEVQVKDLGFKKHVDLPDHIKHQNHGPISYAKTELQHINLDPEKVHFSQRSVNVGKVKHFMQHYDADPKKMNTHDEAREWEAPSVHMYPDGNIATSDHHRLTALMLRGDKTTIARVYTWDHDRKRGGFKQVKTKKDKSIKQD